LAAADPERVRSAPFLACRGAMQALDGPRPVSRGAIAAALGVRSET